MTYRFLIEDEWDYIDDDCIDYDDLKDFLNKLKQEGYIVEKECISSDYGWICKCQHRNAIKFRNENVVFLRYDYLSSGSTKS